MIRLVNPGMADSEMTSHTILLSFQLIQPGEVAPAHRHTMSAFRFILQGHGAYTNVDGQKMVMEDGDLILTPQGCWHEHAHEGDENMVWIDGLDVPFVQALQQISFDPYKPGRLPVVETIDPAMFSRHDPPDRQRHAGNSPAALPLARHLPVAATLGSRHPETPLTEPRWNSSIPATGGPTLPTMSCRVQMLRPNEKTKSHRHTSTSIYHAFRGSGTTMINGEKFHWQKGDTFIVPLWSWHEHANASSSEEAILFSMHDEPILKAFGLYREEAQAVKPSRVFWQIACAHARHGLTFGSTPTQPRADRCPRTTPRPPQTSARRRFPAQLRVQCCAAPEPSRLDRVRR